MGPRTRHGWPQLCRECAGEREPAALVAVVAATTVRLALGTSAGHPSPGDVLAGLRELGDPSGLEPAARQAAGVYVAQVPRTRVANSWSRSTGETRTTPSSSRSLAHVLYQGDGPQVRLVGLDAVEHEALVTLLAARPGLRRTRSSRPRNPRRAMPCSCSADSACPPARRPQPSEHQSPGAGSLSRLASAGLAPTDRSRDVGVIGGEVGFVELDRGTIAPQPTVLMDRAQLLATTAALAGSERAVAAGEAFGAGRDNPPVPPAGCVRPTLRRALETAGRGRRLRPRAADAAGVEAPEPVKLRRVTWWSLVQLAFLRARGLDPRRRLQRPRFPPLRGSPRGCLMGWIASGSSSLSYPGSRRRRDAGLGAGQAAVLPVYAMQLATGYMNLALPSNLARMAINIRFFQRQGIAPTTSVTAGAIDSFASTITQALLLLSLIVLSGGDPRFPPLDLPSGPSVRALVVLISIALWGGCPGSCSFGGLQAGRSVDRLRQWWPEIRATLQTLPLRRQARRSWLGEASPPRSSSRLPSGCSRRRSATTSASPISSSSTSRSRCSASFVPVPGGIGVAEFGLTVGLVGGRTPPTRWLSSFAVVYRTATFYTPPLWGFFAMRWLRTTNRL